MSGGIERVNCESVYKEGLQSGFILCFRIMYCECRILPMYIVIPYPAKCGEFSMVFIRHTPSALRSMLLTYRLSKIDARSNINNNNQDMLYTAKNISFFTEISPPSCLIVKIILP